MDFGLEYTPKSFRRIAVEEARRGKEDPATWFPASKAYIDQLKVLKSGRISTCAPLWKKDPERAREIYAGFKKQERDLRAKKLEALLGALNNLSEDLNTELRSNTFSWTLEKAGPINGSDVYRCADSNHMLYFIGKQVERSIARVPVQPTPSRDHMIAQLMNALAGRLDRTVIRTDISKCFESIPHEPLRTHLKERVQISQLTETFVSRLLDEYAQITGSPQGLPRGVGMSSRLADLYMSDLDTRLSSLTGVLYYGRYVDDIVLVTDGPAALDHIQATLLDSVAKLGLTLNRDKTDYITPANSGGDLNSFPLLGYELRKVNGDVTVSLSPRKDHRIRKKLELTFQAWQAAPNRSSGHDGLLLNRVRFLTGNTKLVNSKSRVMTGIYFSNRSLTTKKQLVGLDRYLAHLVSKAQLPTRLSTALQACSFEAGFADQRVRLFSQNELTKIVAVWRGI